MFLFFSLKNIASDSSVEEIKNILKDIKPFYNQLMIPENIYQIKSNDIKLYQEILKDYIKRYPQNPTNYRIEFLLGYLSYKNREYQNAVKYFQKILGVYTELNDYIMFFLGESYEILKNDERAYQAYSLIDENSLFYKRAIIRKIKILNKLKKFTSIRMFLDNKNELLKNKKISMYYVDSLIELGEYKKAILHLKKMWFQSKDVDLIEKKLKNYENSYKIAKISNLEYTIDNF